MEAIDVLSTRRVPWNKGKLTGQKPPLKVGENWAIRIRLQLAAKTRELAMSNWRSTANCARAISPNCGSPISA